MFKLEAWTANKTADHLSKQLFSVKSQKKRMLESHSDSQSDPVRLTPSPPKLTKLDNSDKSRKHKKRESSQSDPKHAAKRQKTRHNDINGKSLNNTASENVLTGSDLSPSKHKRKGKKLQTKAVQPLVLKAPRNKYKQLALKKNGKVPGQMERLKQDTKSSPGAQKTPEVKNADSTSKEQQKKVKPTKQKVKVKLTSPEQKDTVEKKKISPSKTSNPDGGSKENKRKRKRKKKNNPKKNKYRHLVLSKLEGENKTSTENNQQTEPNTRTSVKKIKSDKTAAFNVSKLKKALSDDQQRSSKQKVNKKQKKNNSTVEDDLNIEVVKPVKKTNSEYTLKEKMSAKLNAARFRYLNEQLYTQSGQESYSLFQDDAEAFRVYHQGFQGQVEKWPSHPLDLLIKYINSRSPSLTVADFGCGDARLAQSVPNTVHSFDLVALNEFVTACDMAKVLLSSESVDVCVFCLSLMGTNLLDYLREANRVLKNGGILKIAEVNSRFSNLSSFIETLKKLGFILLHQNTSNKMFVLLDFKKVSKPKSGPVDLTLMPCVYKRR